MEELKHLRTLWKSGKIQRSTQLIVPKVSHETRSLNNSHWAFNVHFALREALDIKLETRYKDKKPYTVWTQGPIIGFKQGDILHSNDGRQAVQVQFGSPVGIDLNGDLYEGAVFYNIYEIFMGSFIKLTETEKECSQMFFLGMMINGLQ